MYITELLTYMIWPAFIVISWLTVKFVLSAYDKKYPGQE
jgi:hypothetical protein